MLHREEREEIELLRKLVGLQQAEMELLLEIEGLLTQILAKLSPSPQATTALIGVDMPLEVGGTTTATLTFVDASGNPAAPPTGDGSGLDVLFISDTPSVATVGAATPSGDDAVADVDGVSAGNYSLSAVVSNTSGAVLNDDDGTTAFVQPTAVAETVTAPAPPQAVTATITVA